jgi:hypothetical protein
MSVVGWMMQNAEKDHYIKFRQYKNRKFEDKKRVFDHNLPPFLSFIDLNLLITHIDTS